MLVFLFVLDGDGEVALVIDAYAKSSNIVGNQPLLFINPFNIINTS